MGFRARRGTGWLLLLSAMLIMLALPLDSLAFNLDFGNGAGLDCDVTLSYGAAWRT
ncbi:MAG: hypothetical protein JRJ56_07115, partial [Deltaproteobacteria bacterium]|nr:hypothetical protein [Deltaproteobacteria bacterium]